MGEQDRANPRAIEAMSTESTRSSFAVRGLENQCAPLKQYLSKGLQVLDVGCGPGTITDDVAGIVSPGRVYGIDLSQDSIRQATETAQNANLTFKVSDGSKLEFSDGSFDVVYSNSLLEWLRDPVTSLREQRRVARPAGWVIAITNSNRDRVLYPSSPAFEKLLSDYMALANTARTGMYYNSVCSRQAIGMFKAAGFRSLQVQAYGAPVDCVYPGSEFFQYRYETLVKLFGEPSAEIPRNAIAESVWDEVTVRQARLDLDRWHEHPAAFYLQTRLLVAARRE